MVSLTKRQSEIYQFVKAGILTTGASPTLQAIADRFGLASLATVHDHLVRIKNKGYFVRRYNEANGTELTVIPEDGCCPHCGQTLPESEE